MNYSKNCYAPIYLICALFLSSCASHPNTKSLYDFYQPNPQILTEQKVTPLEIGSPAPNFKLPGIDGQYHSLDDYESFEVLAIIFTCNHCPTAQAYEDRLIQVASEFKKRSVQFIAISPTSPRGLLYEELGYTDLDDDFDAMLIRAEDKGFNFPYLYDGDDQKASIQYGPSATPQAFVFDKDRKLRYRGRIDGNEKPGTGHAEDLKMAINQILAGDNISSPANKAFGCSTKWAWKTDYRKVVDKQWSEKAVELVEINEEDTKNLMKNEDSNRLLLVNVWATWCGPCRLEYPDFITLQRMYGARKFEFVSISADKLSAKDEALNFLQEQQSAIRNYIFTLEDKYALIEAIDPNWEGALPYTALIEPDGEIIWSHQGAVDFLDLKKTIVDHPLIGRYY